jgi:hypothetical protein
MNADGVRDLLLSRLRGQRRHVLDQLDGMSEAQLRTAVLPSGWTPLGLVRHLTLSDERYWFEVVMAGGPLDFWPDGSGADWVVGDDEPAADVIAAYQLAAAASDALIEATPIDTPPASPEDWWGEAGLAFPDLHSVMVHMLVETATHAGHLDAARELTDGKQYIVLD